MSRAVLAAAAVALVLVAGIALGVLIGAAREPEPELADRLDGISSTVFCAQTGIGCDG